MRIVATSDCHGMLHEVDVPDGDVLVLAGDVLANRYGNRARLSDAKWQLEELDRLAKWLDVLPHRRVVLIAGNHDFVFQHEARAARKILSSHPKIVYLKDSGAEVCGLKFYGSPHTPFFCDWSFNLPRDGDELRKAWAKIPSGLDVLVTHGPPFGILDRTPSGEQVGCALLLERIETVRPRYSVFGHIHDSYGRTRVGETEFLNVALCDESYMPVQKPLVIDL